MVETWGPGIHWLDVYDERLTPVRWRHLVIDGRRHNLLHVLSSRAENRRSGRNDARVWCHARCSYWWTGEASDDDKTLVGPRHTGLAPVVLLFDQGAS